MRRTNVDDRRRPSRPLISLLLTALVAATALAAATFVAPGYGDDQAAGWSVQPVLSVANSFGGEIAGSPAWLIGASPDGRPGEAWAFRDLPKSAGMPPDGPERLEFGDPAQSSGGSQSVLLRHVDGQGWTIHETPVLADGATAAREVTPVRTSAVATRAGGIAMVARFGGQARLFVRRPGDDSRLAELPVPADVLLPAGPDGPSEALATADLKRAPVAAWDDGERTSVLATAIGRQAETVVHFDGDEWRRDTVEYPAGADDDFKIVALDATGADNAWMIAEAPGRGMLLMRREAVGEAGIWRERSLGRAEFEARETPALGVSEVRSTFGKAIAGTDPLTVTDDGVWLDGLFDHGGTRRSFTLYYDIAGVRVTGSWCDAPADACDFTLGIEFSAGSGSAYGYRSQAWPGEGFGTRVISNPRVPGGDESTNRGTYARLEGERFVRMPGAGFENRVSLAMTSSERGWNGTNTWIGAPSFEPTLTQWSVGVRTPLTDVAAEPGLPAGAIGAGALAVGTAGSVARYKPGVGWETEFLQSSNGYVQRPNLRGVAWPRAGRAHAVGDEGAMWLWRGESGLWERDPGAPIGFVTSLMAVAFDPADPVRGFAVGREGTILEYGKSWRRVCPAGAAQPGCADHTMPDGLQNENFRQIAFSGGQAIIVGDNHVLVSEGGDWRIDDQAQDLVDQAVAGVATSPKLMTVSGLPDGGAFIAGSHGIAIERDSGGSPWRYLRQPIADFTVIESALLREGGQLRALVSAVPMATAFPLTYNDPTPNPDLPPPILPPLTLPADGYLLRQTADGWDDEQRNAFGGLTAVDDKPVKADPVLGLLSDGQGSAWAVGGWTGHRDVSDRGSDDSGQRTTVRTAAILRYRRGAAESAAGNAVASAVPLSPTGVNFLVGGHASCEHADCSELATSGLGPDRQVVMAAAKAYSMSRQANGPRFFAYTGGRSPAGGSSGPRELARLSALLGSQPGLPVFPAVSRGDDPDSFAGAFSGYPAPVGASSAPPGVVSRGGTRSGRFYYAFDSTGANGTVRVIVIDNSPGSLDIAQRDWLVGELRAAKRDAVPAIVVGSRDLNHRFRPSLGNQAIDAIETARLLRDEGASAYFFERPEEHRSYRIPAAEAAQIPSFGTGALGYRSDVFDPGSNDRPSSFFGDTGMLLANVDVAGRDPMSNRAPVTVKLIPLIEGLSLEAVDGALLRRSRPALFRALARRPVGGDRWNPLNGSSSPAGSDPHIPLPTEICRLTACESRIEPEYEFRSSDSDIADFVKVDPSSSNARKPLLVNGKPVTDTRSGLLCAFNEGTTTVSITAGSLSYSRRVTVQAGSVRPPCGTRPLDPKRFTSKPSSPPPPPPPPGPAPAPAISLNVPPAPPPAPPVTHRASPSPFDPFVAKLEPSTALAAIAPPPPPSLARPIPPTGGMARVFEEKREEEVATEDSQAFARFEAGARPPAVWSLGGLALIAALAGATLPRRRCGAGGRPVPAIATSQAKQITNRRR